MSTEPPRGWAGRLASLLLPAMLMLAGCQIAPVAPDTPVEGLPGGTAGGKPSPYSVPAAARPAPTPACGPGDPIGQLTQLQALSLEEQRREHQLAVAAFQAEPSDANRLRLVITLSLARTGWRDDARVLKLLEAPEALGADMPCAVTLSAALLRLNSDRLRLLRDEQRRHEFVLKEEQRSHELLLREELRRYEAVIRDERQKNLEIQKKLDALIDIDRRLRRDTHGVRK